MITTIEIEIYNKIYNYTQLGTIGKVMSKRPWNKGKPNAQVRRWTKRRNKLRKEGKWIPTRPAWVLKKYPPKPDPIPFDIKDYKFF